MARSYANYKYLTVFVAGYVACLLVQGVLLNRLINVWGLYITGGSVVYFLTPLFGDVVAEVYGYQQARQLLWLGFGSVVFMTTVTSIVIRLPAPPFWAHNADAYFFALNSLFRSTVVGIIAMLIGQFINFYLISRWKIWCRSRYFYLRSLASSIIGDGVTVFVSIVGIFYGRVPLHAFAPMLTPELIMMIVVSAAGAIPASFVVRFLVKRENITDADLRIDFNPFKFSVK